MFNLHYTFILIYPIFYIKLRDNYIVSTSGKEYNSNYSDSLFQEFADRAGTKFQEIKDSEYSVDFVKEKIDEILKIIKKYRLKVEEEQGAELLPFENIKILTGDVNNLGIESLDQITYLYPINKPRLDQISPTNPNVILIIVQFVSSIKVGESTNTDINIKYFVYSKKYKVHEIVPRGVMDIDIHLKSETNEDYRIIFDEYRKWLEPLGITSKISNISSIEPN